MTKPAPNGDNIVVRRVVGLGLFVVVTGVLVWVLVVILAAPQLRDHVDRWFVAIALGAGIFMCLVARVTILMALLKRGPRE